MGVKLYIGSTILESAKEMINTIDNGDFLVDNIVVVPDKFSLQMEKLLLNSLPNKALFNVRVLGITELAAEILKDDEKNILSSGESLLLTQKAIENVKKDLLAFNKTNINFCYEINKIIMQLKSSLVTGDDLNVEAKGLAGIKFHDLRLIYNEYESLRTKNDANSRLCMASEYVKKSDIFKNTRLYFAEFDAFTKEAYSLLKSLIIGAKEVNISLAKPYDIGNEYIYEKDILRKIMKLANECGGEYKVYENKGEYFPQKEAIIRGVYSFNDCKCENNGFYTLFSASSVYEEVEAVAKIIYYHVANGYKYSDFSVMVSDIPKYESYIENVFEIFGLPYFIDNSICADKTILAKIVFDFFNVVISHYSSQSLKTLFSNILLDRNEEFIDKIDTLKINNRFKYLKYISDVDCTEIFSDIEKCKKSIEFGQVVRKILSVCQEKYCQILNELEDKKYLKEKNINTQAEQVILEALDLIEKYEGEISINEYVKKLRLLLSFKEVLTVPTYVDGIFVGDATTSDLLDNKVVFIVGGEKLPIVSTDNGFLSDDELLANFNDKQIQPTIRMINRRNRFKLFNLLTKSTSKLIISYQAVNEEGKKNELPSYITSLNKIFGIQSIEKIGEQLNFLYSNENYVGLGNRKSFMQNYYNILNDSVKERLNIDKYNLTKIDKHKINSNGEDIFFENKTARVTQLEQYFSCPFKHFANHGLHLKEKEVGELEVRDVGNICHRGAELFVRENIKNQFSQEIDVKDFVNRNFFKILEDESLMKKFNELVEQESLENYLKKHLMHLLSDIKKEMSVSAFRPKYLEKKFQTLKVGTKEITLIGKVDRIDECGDYFRIIDYKTGATGSILKELYYGNKLQLFLYQKVVAQSLKKRSAGVFYFSAKLEYSKNNEDDKKILKGIAQNDKEVISLFDKNIDINGKSSILAISLSSKEDAYKGSAIAKEPLSVYENYAKAITDKAVDEICEGFIEAKPDEDACEWCPYASICMYEKSMGLRKKKGKIGEFNCEK